MFLLAGGFLMLDPGGIYGAAEAEFRKTYRFLDEKAPSEDEAGEPPGGPGAIRRHTPFTNLE